MAAERLHGDDIDRAGAGKRQDRRPDGSGSTSATTSRSASAGSPAAIFHYSRDRRGERSAGASCWIRRDPAGGRLRRLQQAVSRRPEASGPIPRGGVLGACSAPLLRHGRHRGERAPQGFGEEGEPPLADRYRVGAPHRRAVCHRALDPTAAEPGRAPRGPTRLEPAPGRRSRRPTCASEAGEAVARARPRQGRSSICSSAGRHSRCSSTTGASACPTTPPSVGWQRRRARAKIVAVLRI